jgi:hypothetical protein
MTVGVPRVKAACRPAGRCLKSQPMAEKPSTPANSREERLAAALRENLRRRKAQARELPRDPQEN